MTSDFVLEVGTEEVPAAAVVPALEQLRTLTTDLLTRERIGFGAVRTLGTPRRLVVYVTEVAEVQQDAVLQQRGPTRAVAFDAAGNPTRAAEGFARRYGLDARALQVRATDAGEYVFAEQRVAGKPSSEVLGAAIPGILSALTFPKFMRWGEGLYRFSRPIRWLLALHGRQVVPLEVAGVRAGACSVGHRFLPLLGDGAEANPKVPVEAANEYFQAMVRAQIVVDADERRERILEQGNALAAREGLRIAWDPDLLHEVLYVVEHPTAFLGAFSEEYLELPRPVLVSAMKKHQRYFTVETPDGELAPRFLAVRNGGSHGLDIVRHGNERVLYFRFNDAAHHYREDQKATLEEMRESLHRIVFLEKLGSVRDRADRLEQIGVRLCELAGAPELAPKAIRAAQLCKADLASHMVAELPELQGVIGKLYALRDGEDAEVAAAIEAHYAPKSAGDSAPDGLLSQILALADRLDLLVSALSMGHVPTGSSDPFGLRRAVGAVTTLLLSLPAGLRVADIVDAALLALSGRAYYEQAGPKPASQVREEVRRLLRPRLEGVLDQLGIRRDLVEATLEAGFESLPGTVERARYLQEQSAGPSWTGVVAAGTRIRNILKSTADADPEGSLARLEHPTELALASSLAERAGGLGSAIRQGEWGAAWSHWAALAPQIDRLFLDVLINAPDPELRAARQSLLARLDAAFLALADFSRIADL
jgi:glycyl-tRNA synthetase beta chain